MSVEIKLTLDPASPGLKALKEMASKLERPEAVLKALGDPLLSNTQDRFASQTSPDGAAWAALAPLTVLIRGSAGPILSRSGQLKGSLSWEVSGNTLRLGPNTVYAAIQQFGGTVTAKNPSGLLGIPLGGAGKKPGQKVRTPQVTLPARPYVGFGPEDERVARETIEEWLALE